MNHDLTAERDFDFVVLRNAPTHGQHHRRKLHSIADNFFGGPFTLESSHQGRRRVGETGGTAALLDCSAESLVTPLACRPELGRRAELPPVTASGRVPDER